MRRRTALQTLGALAAGPRLFGCGDGGGDGPLADGITTIVTVMMENRSYDHYLGARGLLEGKPGDGLLAGMSNRNRAGEEIAVFPSAVTCLRADPPHDWEEARVQLGGGANDGFVISYQDRYGDGIDPQVMGYFGREQVPVTWALADHGTSCDRWFSAMLGPTWPNRAYLHSAQSGGIIDSDLPGPGGYDWAPIYQRLDDAGVPWAYYYSDLPVVPLFKDVRVDGTVRRVMWDFFDDALNGTLPPVVFLDPAFGANDDHPPHHPLLGQQFLAAIYGALAASPQWSHLMLVVCYDENGGFYDHVPPPTAADARAEQGFGQLGFRVPALVAGPYARPGQVSSVVHDHTSVIAHINAMFGLAPLTARDAAASDLTDCLDLLRLAARDPLPPVELPAVEIDESMVKDACFRRRSPPTDLERLADTGFFPRHLDRRRYLADTLYGVGDALERLGRGRIRRGR